MAKRPIPLLVFVGVVVPLAAPVYMGLWVLGAPCPLSDHLTGACATPETETLVASIYGAASVCAAAYPARWICRRLVDADRKRRT